MINTRRWADLLNQQYELTSSRADTLDLLLAVRRFVHFLNTDPHAQVYIKELEYNWSARYQDWLMECRNIQTRALQLEQKIRTFGAELGCLRSLPETNPRTDHILGKINEDDWYIHWQDLNDDVDLEHLHVGRHPHTKTGLMVGHVRGLTDGLLRLAKAAEFNSDIAEEYNIQAQQLLIEYESIAHKLQYDWRLSGKHALEQLDIVARIVTREIFIGYFSNGMNWIKSIAPWESLAIEYAPLHIRHEIEQAFHNTQVNLAPRTNFEPLIKHHLRQVFDELFYSANSRLTYIHLVERFKVRCESYDWKRISELLDSHAKQAEIHNKSRQFEDLLTLEFARYLYDNGYAVHYKLRDGVHEPDLLGDNLEPIVIEAKVVGTGRGPAHDKKWIFNGLRGILEYLQKYHSQYGVTEGYLIIFRIGNETSSMYSFEPGEWKIDQFTIVPKIINIASINKEDDPIAINQKDFMNELTLPISNDDA